MKSTRLHNKIVILSSAISFLGSSMFLTCGNSLADADVEVNLKGSQKVLNLSGMLTGFSKAQQMIGTAQELNGQINGLEIFVTAHGATNAGLGLGAYAKAIEKIGVVSSKAINQDQVHVVLDKEVKNAAAALAGYADSEQNIGYMSGKNLTDNTIELHSASRIVNAGGALASHSKAIQNIGSIQVGITDIGDRATADQVKVTEKAEGSIVNTSAAIAAQSIAKQQVGEITASGNINSVTVLVRGKISNTANSLAANVEADQNIGLMQGKADLSSIKVDIEGTVENIGGAGAASADAEQGIGIMDLKKGGKGNQIQLTIDKSATISNAAAGYVGSGTVKQIVGGIFGDEVLNSAVSIEKMGSIYNFGRGIVGKGNSSQLIGVIDLNERTGSQDQITLNIGNVNGSGTGLAGSGKVFENIGLLNAGGHANSIEVTTGNIWGTARGILGAGTSRETIGAILGISTSNSSLAVTTGDIVTSAQGSGTEADIAVGVLDGDSAQNQHVTVTTGSVTAEATGVDSRAEIKIGVVDSNCEVKTLPPHHITVGNINNKNESISATTVIEVGHVYSDVKGPVSLAIKTGNLSIDAKALGVPYNPGIQVGNVKSAGKASVNVTHRDIDLDPYCISWHGLGVCFGTALVRIGNINISNKDKGW